MKQYAFKRLGSALLVLVMLIALVPGAAMPAKAAEEAVTVAIYGTERYD